MTAAPGTTAGTAGPRVELRVATLADPLAQPLLRELEYEYTTRYPSPGGRSRELARYPVEEFEPRCGGLLLLLLRHGEPVAGGAFRRLDERTAELKRIWTHSGHRRQGLGRHVVAALERAAAEAGYQRVYLTTGTRQPEARGLYLVTGYTPLFDVTADPESLAGPLPFAKRLVGDEPIRPEEFPPPRRRPYGPGPVCRVPTPRPVHRRNGRVDTASHRVDADAKRVDTAGNGFHGGAPAAGLLVGDRAAPAPLVERDEDAAEAARRLTAAGAGEDEVVLAAYPRGGRRLAPHPTDLLGWTTPGLLRAAPSVAGAVRPFGPRLGAGLPLADPAVTGWDAADGEVGQVLHRGRVTGTVRRHAVRADPSAPRPASAPGPSAEPTRPAAEPAPVPRVEPALSASQPTQPLRLSGQEREAIAGLLRFPLLAAVNGRRSRRFPAGGRIPAGELAFTSARPVQPLSEAERALVLAVVTGVTGWNFGISHHPGYAPALPNYSGSAVGRTFPSAAGFHTTDFFFTDDSGTYFLSTRDAAPAGETGPGAEPDVDTWLNATTARYRKLSGQRLWLPREEPYLEGHNTWIANHPGSLLVIPVADLAQHLIANLAFFLQNGYGVYDDVNGRPLPGAHDPSLRHAGDPFPLSFVEQYTLAEASAELITGVYNGHLLLGAMGLGGWTFDGIDRLSVLGASGHPDVPGLGFHVQHDERWALPNPTGLTGVFETLSRPHVADAAEAVQRFTERKFGPGGPFHPATPCPWRDTRGVRASAAPYDERFVRLLTGQVRYIDETFGKTPGTVHTVHILNYLQAQHLDPDFYDHHFTPAAYLPTHRDHPSTWH